MVGDGAASPGRRRPLQTLQNVASGRAGGYVVFATGLLLVAMCLVSSSPRSVPLGLTANSVPMAAEPAGPPPPPVLAKMLIMVTFFWDITHLAFLAQVLTTVKAYPVETDIIIVTNKPNRMLNYRATFFDDAPIYRVVGSDNKSDPFGLTWTHRGVVEKALAEGNHTAFMYVEDDVLVRWPTVLAWAEDDALLAPLGFQRGFFRTEFNVESGKLMMMDQHMGTITLSRYNRTVRLHPPVCDRSKRACDFVQLPNPYFGMWVASRERLQHFMTTRYWRREEVPIFPDGPWQVREMAAGSMQFADLPDGFFSAAVVPYNTTGPTLYKNCALFHLPNKYCLRQEQARHDGKSVNFCTEPFVGFIRP